MAIVKNIKTKLQYVLDCVIERKKANLICLAVIVCAVFVGALVPLSKVEAEALLKEYGVVNGTGFYEILARIGLIFCSNLLIALLMMLPVAGQIAGVYTLYRSGMVLAAMSVVHGVSQVEGLFSTLVIPVVWLEFYAFSIAMTEGALLIFKVRNVETLKPVCVRFLFCVILLALAAVLEGTIVSLMNV